MRYVSGVPSPCASLPCTLLTEQVFTYIPNIVNSFIPLTNEDIYSRFTTLPVIMLRLSLRSHMPPPGGAVPLLLGQRQTGWIYNPLANQ